MRRVWLGLGGNIGDVEAALAAALKAIDQHDQCKIDDVSPLYRTPPWGRTDQPWFLNCCAALTTNLTARSLLELCQTIERAGARVRAERWGPRTIDIDIIAIEGEQVDEDGLTVPHPSATERAFVMVPLSGLAPNLVLSGKTVEEWATSLQDPQMQRVETVENWWRVSL